MVLIDYCSKHKICTVKGCGKKRYSNKVSCSAYCSMHRARLTRWGTLEKKVIPLRERFEKFVIPVPECGCHIWTGNQVGFGYGVIKINKKRFMAHRIAWELYKSPIPKGMQVLHHCDTPLCVNTHHLFIGTQLDNMKDRNKKGRANRWPKK